MAGLSLSNNNNFRKGVTPQNKDREDFFSTRIVKEVNTYSSWEEQPLINDVTERKWEVTKTKKGETAKELPPESGGVGIRSIFNKYTLTPVLTESVRAKMNVPLTDSVETRKRIKEASNPSIRNLVEKSQQGLLGRETYSYSDFMYCKYLGSMPNNYLITLRRFPIAIGDYIGNITEKEKDYNDESSAVSLGCMVTWLGTPGNNIEDILTYSYKMPYKEMTAKIEEPRMEDNSTPLGNMFAMFDSSYQARVQKGQAGASFKPFADLLGVPFGDAPHRDQLYWKDPNKIYGPVNVPKTTHMPDDGPGLTFEHSFTLRFEYELRSYSNINTRQAMLDLLANILTVTYVNGSFFGGGYRGFGPHQSSLFTNLKVMKTEGGITDFIDAIASDIQNLSSTVKGNVKQKGGWYEAAKELLNSFGGMLMGGILNKMGRPQKVMVPSLLSGEPVGLWHVTIGNPFHPIMSVGNLILEDTSITHTGPLGLDDFPTKLIVTCKLKRAKVRAAQDIEMLYNKGAVRIYSGMEELTESIIDKAPNYKNTNSVNTTIDIDDIGSINKIKALIKRKTGEASDSIKQAVDVVDDNLMYYFNTHNKEAIKQAGMEWLRGAGKKTKQAKTK